MKKLLVLLMALVMIVTMFALVACGGETEDTSKTTTAESSSVPNTEPQATDSVGTTGGSKGPSSTTPNTPESTPVASTAETTPGKPVILGPNMRDPAKEYYVDSASYKTSSKGEDDIYLYWADAGSNINERYADGYGYIIYEINVSSMIEPTIVLQVRQQYAVYVIDDIDVIDYEDMYCVANFNDTVDTLDPSGFNENGEYTAGTNITNVTIDPYEYDYYGVIYIYVVNSRPEFGHGGTIMNFTVNQYLEGKGPEITTIDNTPGEPHYKPVDAVQISEEMMVNGNDEDEKYIYINTALASDTRRYADGTSFLIYRIDLRNMYEPTVELWITQNYLVEISPNGKDWYEIANFGTSSEYVEKWRTSGNDPNVFNPSGDYLSGDNWTTIVIDPYNPGNNIDPIYGNLYIRIGDCFPSNGWGGAIEMLTIKHFGFVE